MEMVTVTDKAIAALENLIAKGGEDAVAIRLTVKNTGCSGHSYHMEYVRESDDSSKEDIIKLSDKASLHIPRLVSWMLTGTEIDYGTDNLDNERFLFNNPNEVSRCGCGSSFKV